MCFPNFYAKINLKLISTLNIMKNNLENIALKVTKWIGSIWSLIVHTIVFIFIFLLPQFGISFETVMLVFTSLVSMEAIYLSIFIQMTVNQHSEHIADIAEDVEDIQEDIEEISEDVEDIQEDIEELSEEDNDTKPPDLKMK